MRSKSGTPSAADVCPESGCAPDGHRLQISQANSVRSLPPRMPMDWGLARDYAARGRRRLWNRTASVGTMRQGSSHE